MIVAEQILEQGELVAKAKIEDLIAAGAERQMLLVQMGKSVLVAGPAEGYPGRGWDPLTKAFAQVEMWRQKRPLEQQPEFAPQEWELAVKMLESLLQPVALEHVGLEDLRRILA